MGRQVGISFPKRRWLTQHAAVHMRCIYVYLQLVSILFPMVSFWQFYNNVRSNHILNVSRRYCSSLALVNGSDGEMHEILCYDVKSCQNFSHSKSMCVLFLFFYWTFVPDVWHSFHVAHYSVDSTLRHSLRKLCVTIKRKTYSQSKWGKSEKWWRQSNEM